MSSIWTPERKDAQVVPVEADKMLVRRPLVVQIPCGNEFLENPEKEEGEDNPLLSCDPTHLCDNCKMMQLIGQFLVGLIDPNAYGNMVKKAVRNRARQLLGMEILEP